MEDLAEKIKKEGFPTVEELMKQGLTLKQSIMALESAKKCGCCMISSKRLANIIKGEV